VFPAMLPNNELHAAPIRPAVRIPTSFGSFRHHDGSLGNDSIDDRWDKAWFEDDDSFGRLIIQPSPSWFRRITGDLHVFKYCSSQDRVC